MVAIYLELLLEKQTEIGQRLLKVPALEAARNRFRISANVKRWKNHDYPWPGDIDPNFTGSYLNFLSHFKPLSEKPKPVTLPFEKPLVDLEQKITEVRFLF